MKIAQTIAVMAACLTVSIATVKTIEPERSKPHVTLQTVSISAVLRNTGAGWTVLNDSTHAPEHVTGVSVDGSALKVTFDQTFTKVASIAVSPDETFAPLFTAGASVGLSFFYVTLWDATTHLQITDPSTITSPYGNWWVTGTMWKTA